MTQEMQQDGGSRAPQDACPTWAVELISKILILEVEAGTIKSPAVNETEKWSSAKIDDLMKVAAKLDQAKYGNQQDLAAEIESIFIKVVRGLSREGHSVNQITAMINVRIPTGCRLPYCDTNEVQAAL